MTPYTQEKAAPQIYIKRPVSVIAMQYDGSNGDEIQQWCWEHEWYDVQPQDGFLFIHTLEGDMRADPGDWIIRGVRGEFYPCKPDIFAASYYKARQ